MEERQILVTTENERLLSMLVDQERDKTLITHNYERIERLEDENNRLIENNNRQLSDVTTYQVNYEVIGKSNIRENKHLKVLQDEITAINNTNREQKETNILAKLDMDNLRSDHDRRKNEQDCVNKEIQNVRQENIKIRQEGELFKKRKYDESKEIERLKDENNELRHKADEVRTAFHVFNQDNEMQKREYNTWKDNLQKDNKKKLDVQSEEVSKLKHDLNRQTMDNGVLERTNERLEEKIENLLKDQEISVNEKEKYMEENKKIEKLMKELENIITDKEKYMNDYDRIKREKDRLYKDLQAKNLLVCNLNEQQLKCEQDLNSKKEELLASDNQQKVLRVDCEKLATNCNNLNNLNKEHTILKNQYTSLQNVEQELISVRIENEELSGDQSESNKEIERLWEIIKDRDQLLQENQELKVDINSSTSKQEDHGSIFFSKS